jgi:hypothetical protein
MEPYYAAVRSAAAQIGTHHEKQTFLKVIYENFYKVYNPKAADRLGVIYTPNEIVRFMIESADYLCEKHFGRNLIDKDVGSLTPPPEPEHSTANCWNTSAANRLSSNTNISKNCTPTKSPFCRTASPI